MGTTRLKKPLLQNILRIFENRFYVMLVLCQMADALTLWENYKDSMSEDVKMNLHKECQDAVDTDMAFIYNKTLILLKDWLFSMSGHYLQQNGLPTPSRSKLNDTFNRDLQREISYDELKLSQLVKENESKLNIEQQKVYDSLLAFSNESIFCNYNK